MTALRLEVVHEGSRQTVATVRIEGEVRLIEDALARAFNLRADAGGHAAQARVVMASSGGTPRPGVLSGAVLHETGPLAELASLVGAALGQSFGVRLERTEDATGAALRDLADAVAAWRGVQDLEAGRRAMADVVRVADRLVRMAQDGAASLFA